MLDLLDESDSVAANLATEAHKTRGTGENDQVGAAAVRVDQVVRDVLGDSRYLRRARELEVAYAQRDGVAEIAALIDEVVSERSAAVKS